MAGAKQQRTDGGVLRRRVTACGVVAGVCGVAVAAALYVAALILSDRVAATQWLAWIPKWMLAVGSALTLALAGGSWVCAGRPGGWRRVMVAVGGVAALGVVGHAWLVDQRGLVRLGGSARATAERGGVRVVVWNATRADAEEAIGALAAIGADVYVVTHARGWTWGDELASATSGAGEPLRVYRAGLATVVSRFGVSRAQVRGLGLDTLATGDDLRAGDQSGTVTAFEVESDGVLGRAAVVWVVDLPSDPSIPRMAAMRAARDRLGGPARPEGENPAAAGGDRWVDGPAGLARADVVAGDFNIQRGSVSLEEFVGAMRGAHDLAGGGGYGSWPRRRPTLHIDQAFAAEWLGVVSYRLVDLGTGTHLAQVFDLVPAAGPR